MPRHARRAYPDTLRLDHDVDEMGNRRALVAAYIGHAGLQQRLGDGENALAVEGFPVTQLSSPEFSFWKTFPCMCRAFPAKC